MTDGAGFLFVLPSFPKRAASVDPLWITTSGLTRALGARLGGAEVLTPDGISQPDEVAARGVRPPEGTSVIRGGLRRLPRPVRVGLGDLREWARARRMRTMAPTVAGRSYRLVMQHHRRFHDCGFAVAEAAGIPIVLRLDALEVREEAGWGVHRPGWGRIVENLGELRLIRRADLVASVSEEVDASLAALGVEDERRVVVPNGVDLDAFAPGELDSELKRSHGLDGRCVVGWIGGFRPFHGLELVPDIARGLRDSVPEAVLCLIGAGPLRSQVADRIRGLEDVVRIIDPVPHSEVPRWMRSFDICLLLAGRDEFHYSPLKLYEYLGCGRPVVAPRLGEMARVLSDGRDAVLVPPNDPGAIVQAVRRLHGDAAVQSRLGAQGRASAERNGSWDARASTVLEAVEARGWRSRETRASSSHG